MNKLKLTPENTQLIKFPSGHGHWVVSAHHIIYNMPCRITTNNSLLIDDAFNSNEGDTSYYQSVNEARQILIDMIIDKNETQDK